MAVPGPACHGGTGRRRDDCGIGTQAELISITGMIVPVDAAGLSGRAAALARAAAASVSRWRTGRLSESDSDSEAPDGGLTGRRCGGRQQGRRFRRSLTVTITVMGRGPVTDDPSLTVKFKFRPTPGRDGGCIPSR